MPRNLVIASLIAIFTFAAAPAMARAAPVFCPDTYCGLRPYADPYIWYGWRRTPSNPDYGRSSYLFRTLRPIYVDHATYLEYQRTGYLPSYYLKRYRHDGVRTKHRHHKGHHHTGHHDTGRHHTGRHHTGQHHTASKKLRTHSKR